MKSFAAQSLIAVFLLFPIAIGQHANGQDSDKRAEFRKRILERFDKNKDGKLDEAERQAARKAFEERAGSDRAKGRGKTDRAKKGRAKSDRGGQGNATDRRKQMLARFDENKNGRLDPPELAKLRQALPQLRREFQKNNGTDRKKGTARKKGDAGKKGATDRPANRDVPPQILQRFDRNKNGKLDRDELARLREARQSQGGRRNRSRSQQTVEPRKNRVDQTDLLKRFDANNNGKLDGAERQKGLEALNKNRE